MSFVDSLDELAGPVKHEFVSLLRALVEGQDRHGEYEKKERALTQFIADLPPNTRVLARGDVHGVGRHCPAVLFFSPGVNEVKVLAPSGPNYAVEAYPLEMFWSKVPHIAFARSLAVQSEQNSSS